MTVRGSCSCYGHAEKCLPEKPEHADVQGKLFHFESFSLFIFTCFRYGTWKMRLYA